MTETKYAKRGQKDTPAARNAADLFGRGQGECRFPKTTKPEQERHDTTYDLNGSWDVPGYLDGTADEYVSKQRSGAYGEDDSRVVSLSQKGGGK